jgi:UDP-3-O-acyl N-acetylglucosamine deacetylase
MEKQNTIGKPVCFSGIALHTGARAILNMIPAPENSGIVFRRIDLPGKPEVRACANNVTDVRRGTTISEGDGFVVTVEHVMASLNAFEIDNVLVEMDGAEPPIGDGSALPYLNMIKEAGIVPQDAEAKYWAPKENIVIENGVTQLILIPHDKLKITCMISFGGTPLDTQFQTFEINSGVFEEEIASARTFCLFKELEQLLAMGLVKGGSLDNAVVIHDGAIICKDGLRYQDELVRHKMLDIIGDIYLTGRRIKAHIIAVKPGHPTNVQMAQMIIKQMEK